MGDIVKRLRKTAPLHGNPSGYMGDTMREAADEIERLRAIIHRARCAYPPQVNAILAEGSDQDG